jgi:hypothetical protein
MRRGLAQEKKDRKEFLEYRRSLTNEIKSRYGCQCCEEKEPVALDFHHLEEKEFHVSEMLKRNMPSIISEINKCIVLCANCHRKFHAGLIKLNNPRKCNESIPERRDAKNQYSHIKS